MIEIYKSDIIKFKESVVWREIEKELNGTMIVLVSSLMTLNPQIECAELARAQGRLEALKTFLEMPDDLYADALEEREKEMKEEKDNE